MTLFYNIIPEKDFQIYGQYLSCFLPLSSIVVFEWSQWFLEEQGTTQFEHDFPFFW